MNESFSPELLCMNCMAYHTNESSCPSCGFEEKNYQISPHHLPLRTILSGKYLVGRVLGEGGFGITYLGWDLNLDLKIAIKEYYPTGFVTRENTSTNTVTPYTGEKNEFFQNGRDKFVEEAKRLAKFYSLPGIVSIKDFFLENGTAYIVMEYVEGETLKQYLARMGGKVPSDMIFELMKPLVKSLIEVHNAGIIHRDISPDNIMITKEGYIKLIDFGAARDFANSGNRSLSVMLKPGYAPEEQYRSRGVQGPWTDIYALCATIYKAITGITPDESIERTHNDELKKPSELGIVIHKEQENVLMKGMSVLQQHRYQNVNELFQTLYHTENNTVYNKINNSDMDNSIHNREGKSEDKSQEEISESQSDKSNYLKTVKASIAVVGFLIVFIIAIALNQPKVKDNNSGETSSYEPVEADITSAASMDSDASSEEPIGSEDESGYNEPTVDITSTASTDSETYQEEPIASDDESSYYDPPADDIASSSGDSEIYQEESISSGIETMDEQGITAIEDRFNIHCSDTVVYTEDLDKSYSIDTAQTIPSEMDSLAGTLSTALESDYYHIEIPEDNSELHVILDPEYEIDFYNIRIRIVDQYYNILYDGKVYDPTQIFIRYNAVAYINQGDSYVEIYRIDDDLKREMNYQLYFFIY